VKRSDFLESLRLRIPPLPRPSIAGLGAPLQFAASGGGGGGYDDPDDDYYDDIPDEPAPRRRDERQTAGRQRTVQSDPDDRYWTDYLRIALPVIGLLLVIAVFWFWAQQLIDNPEDDVTPTEPGLAEVIESPTEAVSQSAATPTPSAAGNAGQSVAPPTTAPQNPQQAIPSPTPAQPAAQEDTGTDNQVAAEPTQPPADASGGSEIAPDMQVTVIEGPLRLRAEASTESDIVTELETGTVLTVLSGPEEAEGYTWWQVVEETGGSQGWVAQEFIEPAG
jgi:hypothetical protein